MSVTVEKHMYVLHKRSAYVAKQGYEETTLQLCIHVCLLEDERLRNVFASW